MLWKQRDGGVSCLYLPWRPSLGNIDSLRCSLVLHRVRCASSHPVGQKKKEDNMNVRAERLPDAHATYTETCNIFWTACVLNDTCSPNEHFSEK